MRRWLGRSPAQLASLLGFVVVCAVWTVMQVEGVPIGCDGERYLLAGRAMALGMDPYARGGLQTYLPYPPFLAWALDVFALADRTWVWQLLVALSAVVLLYATLAVAGLDTSRLLWLGPVLLAGQSFAGDIATANVQLPVAALLALALLAANRERHGTAGVLCGLAAALKVLPALLIAFLALRAAGRWERPTARAALAGAVVGAAALLTPWTRRWFELVVLGTGAEEYRLAGGNLSWPAVTAQAGLPLPTFVPSLLSLAATVVVARTRRLALLPSLAIVVALALAGSPVAWGFAYLTLLPAIAVLLRELRRGHHFVGETRRRRLVEYGSVLAFTMIAVNADHFYLRDIWVGRHLLPFLPLLGTLLLAWALWRTQAGASPTTC
jgi:hypothetical protein